MVYFFHKFSIKNILCQILYSPDGSYLLATGVRQNSDDKNVFNGYILKLDIKTGKQIWELDIGPDSGNIAGSRSGFETIAFTKDGGFIVGGFFRKINPEFPPFKSQGQVDDAHPIVHKFSTKLAESETPTDTEPIWAWFYNMKYF